SRSALLSSTQQLVVERNIEAGPGEMSPMVHKDEQLQLPDLAQEYPVSADRVARYRRDGHLLLRQVASSYEIRAYRPPIVDAAVSYNTQTRPLDERDTYGKAFLQIINLWQRDAAVRRFVLARRFAKLAADLMGV